MFVNNTMNKESDMSIVLITGASSGMGKETANRLLREGHTVYAAARRLEQMHDLQEMGAIILKLDISLDSSIINAVQTIIARHGGVDVLINNAGFATYGSVEETSIDDARYQFEVNLFGLGRLTKLLLPAMRKKGSGKIINVSSMGGKIYTPLGAWYHATKHAIEGWSDCLRIELASLGIDVIIVEPGIIATDFGNVMLDPMLQRSGSGPYKRLAQGLA
jgi:short-subunit dehydrogenase